jgi:hypothetical protein
MIPTRSGGGQQNLVALQCVVFIERKETSTDRMTLNDLDNDLTIGYRHWQNKLHGEGRRVDHVA